MSPIQTRAERVRGIALEPVLRLAGAQPDPHDRHKWHTSEGVISLTGPKFMNWTRGISGGGAIDLVIHLHHRGFIEASKWLEQHFPNTSSPLCLEPFSPPHLRLPVPKARNLWRVQGYLRVERGIRAALIAPLIDSALLYADPKANAVFLLLGDKNHPVGAELRGTTGSPWRGMAPGSQKDQGYFAIGPACASSLILCESAIDAISCFSLHPEHRCLSTAGARVHPRWLPSLIEQGFQIGCGYDAEPTGDAMAQAMIARFSSVQRLRPSQKDWNDLLRFIGPAARTYSEFTAQLLGK